jgi:dCMP deaminase
MRIPIGKGKYGYLCPKCKRSFLSADKDTVMCSYPPKYLTICPECFDRNYIDCEKLSGCVVYPFDKVFDNHRVYLEMAHALKQKSHDQEQKVACIIVAADGTIASSGYNGTARGFRDDIIPHSRQTKELSYIENGEKKTFTENKNHFMLHSERNAIRFCDNKDKLRGATAYVTKLPCPECSLEFADSGISCVVVEDRTKDPNTRYSSDATKMILAEAGICLIVDSVPIALEKYVD